MKPLQGKIALMAGSSRGAGKGVALPLGDAGATVYVAARTSRSGPKPADEVPGTLWVADLAKEYGFTDVDGLVIPLYDPTAPPQPFPC